MCVCGCVSNFDKRHFAQFLSRHRCVYILAHTHTHTHTHIQIYIGACRGTHKYTCTYTHTHTHTHTCITRLRQQKPDAQNFNSKKTFKKQFKAHKKFILKCLYF